MEERQSQQTYLSSESLSLSLSLSLFLSFSLSLSLSRSLSQLSSFISYSLDTLNSSPEKLLMNQGDGYRAVQEER